MKLLTILIVVGSEIPGRSFLSTLANHGGQLGISMISVFERHTTWVTWIGSDVSAVYTKYSCIYDHTRQSTRALRERAHLYTNTCWTLGVICFSHIAFTLYVVKEKNVCTSPRRSVSTCVSETSVIPHPKLPGKRRAYKGSVFSLPGFLEFGIFQNSKHCMEWKLQPQAQITWGLALDFQRLTWGAILRSQAPSHFYMGVSSQTLPQSAGKGERSFPIHQRCA